MNTKNNNNSILNNSIISTHISSPTIDNWGIAEGSCWPRAWYRRQHKNTSKQPCSNPRCHIIALISVFWISTLTNNIGHLLRYIRPQAYDNIVYTYFWFQCFDAINGHKFLQAPGCLACLPLIQHCQCSSALKAQFLCVYTRLSCHLTFALARLSCYAFVW